MCYTFITHMYRPKPPTVFTIAKLQTYMRACSTLEVAAMNVGISRPALYQMIKLGRAGDPDYQPFVSAVDKTIAEIADSLLEPIRAAAKEGNVKALQFLYKERVKPHLDRHDKRQHTAEDEGDAQLSERYETLTPDELAALEAEVSLHDN